MSAGAGFVADQGAGLTDWASHQNKHFHKLAAVGAFHFREPGRSLSLLTSFYQHRFSLSALKPLGNGFHKVSNLQVLWAMFLAAMASDAL